MVCAHDTTGAMVERSDGGAELCDSAVAAEGVKGRCDGLGGVPSESSEHQIIK